MFKSQTKGEKTSEQTELNHLQVWSWHTALDHWSGDLESPTTSIGAMQYYSKTPWHDHHIKYTKRFNVHQ